MGSKVEVQWSTGAWYPATIIDVSKNQYKIHLDGDGDDQKRDQWIFKDKGLLRPVKGGDDGSNTVARPTDTKETTVKTEKIQEPKTVSSVNRASLVNVWKYDKMTIIKKGIPETIGASAKLMLEEDGSYTLVYDASNFDRGNWKLSGNKLSLISTAFNQTLTYNVSFSNNTLILKDNVGGTIEAITWEAYKKQWANQ
jgi:hypothetical protein